jgi:hypothetical protein
MRRLIAIFIGSTLLCSVAVAQQTQTGSVSGTVALQDGEPLPGVIVQAAADVLPKARATVTGANGEYRVPALPPGDYELILSLHGFATEKRSFPVHLQHNAVINVEMKTARFEDEIIITAEVPTIDTTSAEIKASISDEVIEMLPVGQQYRDLIKLIPGVQYTEDKVRGAPAGGSGQDNVYEFDGVSVNRPLFGNLSAQPSSHDIEEVAVVKGGANAIGFNRSGGFLINTLSKSGTNQFRGELSYQVQNAGMTGPVHTESEARSDENQDWLAANFGGPLIPEMLYFFVSYYRPTTFEANRSNAYGEVPDRESIRNEYFGKLTFNPADSIMLSGSYRHSERDNSGYGVSWEYAAGSASYGQDATMGITVLEGTWVVNDNSYLSVKYSDFEDTYTERPDLLFGFPIAIDGSVRLDVDNLDQQGLFEVPQPIGGEDDYNAFIAPLITRYGYLDNGVPAGGGLVGGDYVLYDRDFSNESFQVGYDSILGNHELHVGYRWSLGTDDRNSISNGWGFIEAIGGLDETDEGVPVYFLATIREASIADEGGQVIPPIHSEIESQSIELNDVWRVKSWTFNLGVIFSNDKLYGQGLRKNSDNVSGYELAPGNKYLMKEMGFDEMISPRLGATWSPNGKDAMYASYARYYPAATSLPQAASWARNLNRRIWAQFDAEGNLIGVDRSIGAASGKWFQEGITPRFIDEFAVGYDKQISRAWTGRIHARHRKAKNFWEDTDNNARLLYDPPEGVPQELYVPNLDEIQAELGGGDYVIAQLDGAYTKYYELSTEAEWRGRNAFFRGSYVWSHYYGNFDQDGTNVGGDANIYIGSSYIADGAGRQLWNFREGNLRGDRRHMLKLYGFYQLPWNGAVGAFGVYQSGQPWETWDWTIYSESYPSGGDYSRYAEPAGSRTTDSHYQLDLSYTQNFPIGSRFNVLIRGEVFNVTDNQTSYNIERRISKAGFGEPRDWFDPRRFQLTVGFQF